MASAVVNVITLLRYVIRKYLNYREIGFSGVLPKKPVLI